MPPKRPTKPTELGDCADPKAGCEVADLFRLLGRSHVMGILHLFLHESPGPHRFVDIQRRLAMSPNTLTQRLKDLVDAGLLSRTAYQEIPPRVDYQATKKAHELAPVFGSLIEWAKRNDLAPAGPVDVPAQA